MLNNPLRFVDPTGFIPIGATGQNGQCYGACNEEGLSLNQNANSTPHDSSPTESPPTETRPEHTGVTNQVHQPRPSHSNPPLPEAQDSAETNAGHAPAGDGISGQHTSFDWDLKIANYIDDWGIDDIAAGIGDSISFGLTRMFREAGNVNATVQENSGAYIAGEVTGIVATAPGAVIGAGRVVVAGVRTGVRAVAKAPRAAARAVRRARRARSTCFVAGTLVAIAGLTSSNAAANEFETDSIPIEELRVGDRVWTAHLNEAFDPSATNITSEWLTIDLELSSQNASLTLLRPASWLEQVDPDGDGSFFLELEEMGILGEAKVISVRGPPDIAEGPGRVVLSTMRYEGATVSALTFDAEKEPIVVTGSHPFYSLDRDTWISAGELQIGETVQTQYGKTALLARESLPGEHTVYNIEVEEVHEYLVGHARLRVHNSCPGVSGGAPPPNMSPPGAGRRGAFREAKRQSGIPVSQQPRRVGPNLDRRGKRQPGRTYEFEVPTEGGGRRTVRIRDDASGHDFGPGNPQNRGPHFNDEAGNHFDY